MWHLSEPSYVDAHRKHADAMLPRVRAPSDEASTETTDAPAAVAGGGGRTRKKKTIRLRGRAVPLNGAGGGGGGAVGANPPEGALLPASTTMIVANGNAGKKQSWLGNSSSSSREEDVTYHRGLGDEDEVPCVMVLDAGPAVLKRCRGKALTDKEQSKRVRLTTPELHCERRVSACPCVRGGSHATNLHVRADTDGGPSLPGSTSGERCLYSVVVVFLQVGRGILQILLPHMLTCTLR